MAGDAAYRFLELLPLDNIHEAEAVSRSPVDRHFKLASQLSHLGWKLPRVVCRGQSEIWYEQFLVCVALSTDLLKIGPLARVAPRVLITSDPDVWMAVNS